MTLVLFTATAGLLLAVADVAIGRPDHLDRHATVAERLAARIRPARMALTVLVAVALPLAGAVQVLKVAAHLAGLQVPVAVPA
jgi:hypothetical protein